MTRHLNIQVFGKVQAVWFRRHTEKQANHLGLKGFVQNQPDGSVYIEVEGPAADLDQFVAWCYEGSPEAEVAEVRVKPSELIGYESFAIRY